MIKIDRGGGRILLPVTNFTPIVRCRTSGFRNGFAPFITGFAGFYPQESPDKNLSVTVPTQILYRPKVSPTQQAGWPWLAYPSRLTLRNIYRPRLFSDKTRAQINPGENEAAAFIASLAMQKIKAPRVLYIEDHDDTRELVTLVLEQKSYEVVTGSTIKT